MRVAKLWWCTTPDHEEDWFVVAPSEGEACRFHEAEEGYEAGDADGELVCWLPEHLQAAADVGWPTAAVVEACGGEFVSLKRDARVVRFGDRVFAEGNTADVVATLIGMTRKN